MWSARAQTGTGKTAAFGVPILQRLSAAGRTSQHTPRVLILVPTRELALQVHASLKSYAVGTPIQVTAIFGGVGMGNQLRDLRQGTDIIVATPGQLLDHMTRRAIDLSAIEVLTLDEADRMLDMGFQPALAAHHSGAARQAADPALLRRSREDDSAAVQETLTRDAARVDVVRRPRGGRERHASLCTPWLPDQKRAMLTHLLKRAAGDQALVFCKTKRGSDRVGEYLEDAGITVAGGFTATRARAHGLGR